MKRLRKIAVFSVILALLVLVAQQPRAHAAETRISIGVTETMETFNPYGDSVSLMYSIWCQVLGCLGTYDFDKNQPVGLLVERWEVKDPKTWIFHLRRDIKFHNGMPLTAEDVVHSINRIRTDPLSKQRQNISAIASEAVIDSGNLMVGYLGQPSPRHDGMSVALSSVARQRVNGSREAANAAR